MTEPAKLQIAVNQRIKLPDTKATMTANIARYGHQWETQTVTPDGLLEIMQSVAYAVGTYRNKRRLTSHFISGQLLYLDIDSGKRQLDDLLADNFIAEYAFAIQGSRSYTPDDPKWRIVFILSDPITDAGQFRAIFGGLADRFAYLEIDQQIKDAARLSFPSPHAPAYVNKDARLPLNVASGLIKPPAAPPTAPAKPVTLAPPDEHERYQPYIESAIQNGLAAIATAPTGQRNETLWRETKSLAGFIPHGLFTEGELWGWLETAAASYIATDGQHAFEATVKSGMASGLAHPRDLSNIGTHRGAGRAVQSNATPTATADPETPLTWHDDNHVSFNLPYMTDGIAHLTDDAQNRDMILVGKLGTGKTHAVKAHWGKINPESILAISHRISLVQQTAIRLNLTSYQDDDISMVDRGAVCLPSLRKDSVGGDVQRREQIFIDEIEQVISQLFEPGLLSPTDSYKTTEYLVTACRLADQLIAADAHAGPLTDEFFRLVGRKPALKITNTHQRIKGLKAEIIHNQNEVERRLDTALAQYAGKKPIAVATDSINRAIDLHSKYEANYRVMVVHSHNSQTPDVQDFLTHINERLPDYDLLIYSPSIGSGVDIQAEVAWVFGFYGGQHLIADDIMQQLGRTRNVAQGIVIYHRQQDDIGHRPENLAQIMHEGLKTYTDVYNVFARLWDANGKKRTVDDMINDLGEIQKIHYKLYCVREMTRNYQLNRPLDSLIERLQAAGYTVRCGSVKNDDELKAIKSERDQRNVDRKAREKAMVLTADPISEFIFKTLQEQGKATDEHRAGYKRWEIEQLYGDTISSFLYDEFERYGYAVTQFALLLRDGRELSAKDRKDLLNPNISKLVDRKDRFIKMGLYKLLLAKVFGETQQSVLSSDTIFTTDDLKPFERAVQKHKIHIRQILGVNPDSYKTSIGLLKAILGNLGLTLIGDREPGGKKRMEYHLDPDRLAIMHILAFDYAEANGIELGADANGNPLPLIIPRRDIRLKLGDKITDNCVRSSNEDERPKIA